MIDRTPRPEGLDVLGPGTPVKVGEGQIPAVVVSVSIHWGPHVTYEVAWWANGERHTAWCEDWELARIEGVDGAERVGFSA